MAVTAREIDTLRTFSGTSASRTYWLASLYTDDEDDARDALLAAAPLTWEAGGVTLTRDDDSCEVSQDGAVWFGTVGYTSDSTAGSGSDNTAFEFDTAGGTQHIIVGYATIAAAGTNPRTGAAAAVADNGGDATHGGIIGATKDGAEGCDIEVGALNFSITKSKAISTLTASYLNILADMVGRTNDATFAGTTDDGVDFSYATGCCKLLGTRGGVRGGRAIITYSFAANSDKTALPIGSFTIDKKAWDYLFVLYAETGAAKVPKAAYTERVHLRGDFSTLACT